MVEQLEGSHPSSEDQALFDAQQKEVLASLSLAATTPSPASVMSDLDELDDFEADDVPDKQDSQRDSGAPGGHQPRGPPTLWDEFNYELDLVWRAIKFVLASWARVPVLFPRIIYHEIDRFISFWLGRPVPPRMWEFRLPSADDL